MAINTLNINLRFVTEEGKPTQAFFRSYSDLIAFTNNQPVTLDYEGSPEGNVVARFKDQCWDTINNKLYFKSTLSGDTGWVALN